MRANSMKLTPFGRWLLVDRVLVPGWAAAGAAESVGVSRQTAYRWLRRWREEGETGLWDRSPRPHRCPSRVPQVTEERIVADRVTEKKGPHFDGRVAVQVPVETVQRPSLDWEH